MEGFEGSTEKGNGTSGSKGDSGKKKGRVWSGRGHKIQVADIVPVALAQELSEIDSALDSVKAELEAAQQAREEFEALEEGCYYRRNILRRRDEERNLLSNELRITTKGRHGYALFRECIY